MRKISVCILLALSLCNCETKNPLVIEIDQGESKGVLNAGFIGNLDTPLPDWIEVVEDSMILIIDRTNNPAIQLYSLPDFKKIASTGSRGNGPFEFTTPKVEGRSFKEHDSLYVYISDTNAHKLFKLNISRLINGQKGEFKFLADIDPDVSLQYLEIFTTDEKTAIGTSWGNDGRVFLWNIATNKSQYLPDYPKAKKSLAYDLRGSFFYSYSAYHREKKIMVSAMKIFKEVDFFDHNGRLIKSIYFNDDKRKEPDLIADGYPYPAGTKIYFARSYATRQNFYTTCENTIVGGSTLKNYELYIFDWEGNYKGRWQLEKFNLGHFAVSEKYKKIYAVNYTDNMEEYPLITYDLSAISFE